MTVIVVATSGFNYVITATEEKHLIHESDKSNKKPGRKIDDVRDFDECGFTNTLSTHSFLQTGGAKLRIQV